MYSRMTQAYDSLVESETVTTCVWGTVYNNMNFSGNKTDTNTDSVPTLQQAVYTGSSLGHIKVWYLKEESGDLELKYVCKQKSSIVCLLLNNANTQLVSKTLEGCIRIFDASTMEVKFQFRISSTLRNVNIQFSIDEMFLLTESSDTCLSFYDIGSAEITSTYEIGPHFTSYILSHKGDVIIVGYADGTVKTFDCVSGENVVTIRNPNIGSVTCLVTCFKSFYLILGFSSGLIKLYSQTHGELLKIYEKPHKTAVVSIAVNPNNKTFVTLSRDFIMKVWNMTETLPEVKIKEHRDLPLHIKYADPELTAGLDFKGVDNIKSYLVSKEGGHYNFLPPPSLQQTPGQVSFSRDGKKLLSVAHQFIAIHSCPRSQARL
uniref:WD repeat-containing protein 61 n=1 Tax=Cacopsylla melanoneura TaxID=428564 RepID=A0A8D8WB01_9HEMI